MFDSPPEQPQSVGDLIGRAFRIYRRHLPLFFRVLLGPTIAATLGTLCLQLIFTYGFTPGQSGPSTLIACGLAGLASLILLMVSKFILTLRQLSLVRMSAGFAGDYAESYSFVCKRKWLVLSLLILGVVAVFVASIIWLIGMTVLFAVPRGSVLAVMLTTSGLLLGSMGFFLTLCLTFLVGLVILAVLACEDTSLNQVISRGWNLTMADLGRTCAFGLLLLLAVFVLSYPLSLPVVALSFVDIIHHELSPGGVADPYKMPVYVMIISNVWESLVNMLLWPAIFLSYGLFYYDLRLRQEGIDILRNVEVLGSELV